MLRLHNNTDKHDSDKCRKHNKLLLKSLLPHHVVDYNVQCAHDKIIRHICRRLISYIKPHVTTMLSITTTL